MATKESERIRNKRWKDANRAKVNAKNRGYQIRKVMQRLGLTEHDYGEAAQKQNFTCAICFRDNGDYRLVVDHHHKDNRFRGLLCTNCNSVLGIFQDDVERFLRAAIYLENYERNKHQRHSLTEGK